MTTQPKMQRTPGEVAISTSAPTLLVGEDGKGVADCFRSPRVYNTCRANIAHISACWNACERAGGDPAAVEELVVVLDKVISNGHVEPCKAGTAYSDRVCTCPVGQAEAALVNARPEPKGDDDGVHDRE